MAKTNKRRAARASRHAKGTLARAPATTNPAAAAALFTNHDWKQLTDALDGLLRIERSSPFTDLEHFCPAEAWLVVDLSDVRQNASAASGLRREITRIVTVLEKLCVHAQMLRPYADLYTAFWTRVLTSDVNQDVHKDGDTPITDMIRFMQVKGTHLALRWHGRRLQPGQVITPLHRLMGAVVGTSTSFRCLPVQLSLRFEECELTNIDIHSVHELLQKPQPPSSINGYLCEPTVLKELSLRSNALYPHHLEALTALLEDSTARRIDSLCLGNTTPHDAIRPHTYPAIFERMLSIALRPKTSLSPDTPDKGLRLSFDQSEHLDAELIDAIENALRQATRPVRALSFASVTPPGFGALRRLTRVLLTPLPTATEDFELDLTCVNGDGGLGDMGQAVYVSLAEMVTEAIPHIYSAGLLAGERVTCRLLYPETFEDQLLIVPIDDFVSTDAFYDMVGVTHNGLFQIGLTEYDVQGRRRTGWVPSTAIAHIRIGNANVVGSSCTQLILDGNTHAHSDTTSRFVDGMLASFGAFLKHLSLRGYVLSFGDLIYDALEQCPGLIELNACNGFGHQRGHVPVWPESPAVVGPLLQILDVSNCGLTGASLRSLPSLPSLQCLRLAENKLHDDALVAILERLRMNRTLRFVDVSASARRDAEDEARYRVAKTHVETHLRQGYVTLKARLAFLGMVRYVEETRKLSASVPLDVLASIVGFTGTRASCVVAW